VPKPKKGPRLGSNPGHQRLLLSTLAVQLFTHEAIDTTEAKAKALRPYAEKLITKAKRGDLAARRDVLKDIPDRDVVARELDVELDHVGAEIERLHALARLARMQAVAS